MNRKNGPMLPADIRALTLPELLIALDDDMEKPRPFGGRGVEMSDQERRIWIAWRRTMTGEQRLAALTGQLPVEEQLQLAVEWDQCQRLQSTM